MSTKRSFDQLARPLPPPQSVATARDVAIGAIACLLATLGAFLWIFELPALPVSRSLPCYSLCISEYVSAPFPEHLDPTEFPCQLR